MGSPTIIKGIKKAYIAILTTDDSSALTYEDPEYYQGVNEITTTPQQTVDDLPAEDQLWWQDYVFQKMDIGLTLVSLTSAQRAKLLGHHIATDGGVYSHFDDIPPYVALLYKATIAGGYYRYGVFYKGMFTLGSEPMKSRETNTTYSKPSLTASFIPTVNNGMWEYHVDTSDPDCPSDIDDTWFTAVKIPSADSTAPTVTSVPADADTGVSASASIVFTFSKAIDPNVIKDSNSFLMESDGTAVAATISANAAYTVITLAPDSNMSAGDYVAVVTKNVRSASGVNLASNYVVNFTV